MRKYITVIFILCLLTTSPGKAIALPAVPLDIITQKETLHFTVEVAATAAEQEYGFMYRETVPDGHGMIFVFTPPQPVDMWMEHTPASLDMLFIDAHGIITKIAPRAMPESTDIIHSDGDVSFVLEVAGGTAERSHIAKGDKVLYPVPQ